MYGGWATTPVCLCSLERDSCRWLSEHAYWVTRFRTPSLHQCTHRSFPLSLLTLSQLAVCRCLLPVHAGPQLPGLPAPRGVCVACHSTCSTHGAGAEVRGNCTEVLTALTGGTVLRYCTRDTNKATRKGQQNAVAQCPSQHTRSAHKAPQMHAQHDGGMSQLAQHDGLLEALVQACPHLCRYSHKLPPTTHTHMCASTNARANAHTHTHTHTHCCLQVHPAALPLLLLLYGSQGVCTCACVRGGAYARGGLGAQGCVCMCVCVEGGVTLPQ